MTVSTAPAPAPATSPTIESSRLRYAFHPDLLAGLFLLALTGLFFARVLFTGQVLLPTDSLYAQLPWSAFREALGVGVPHNELIGDMIVQNYSWKNLIKSSYLDGEFPLWNPYVLSGVPFLAAGQYAALYPPGVLFLILPVEHAYGWFTALHVFLAGLFSYAYLRVLRVPPAAALVAGVAFMFCGFLTVSYLWPMVLSTAIWAPLLLALIELAIRPFECRRDRAFVRALPFLFAGAVAVGLQFLAGHLEISFYVLFTIAFYAAARLIAAFATTRSLLIPVAAGLSLSGMVALGFGVAMAQLLPFLELIQANFRSGFVSYEEVLGYALPWKHVAAFLLPDVFGNPTHHLYFNLFSWDWLPVEGSRDAGGNLRSYPFWGTKNYVEGAAYLGLLPLLLAPIAWIWRRDRYTIIWTAFAGLALLFAFGTAIFRVLWVIPGFDQLHTPFRWIFPYTIAVTTLAGLGLGGLLAALSQPRRELFARRFRLTRLWLVAATGLGIAVLAGLALSRILSGPTLDLAERALRRSETLAFAFPSPEMLYSYQAINILKFSLLLAVSAGAVLWLLRRARRGVNVTRGAAAFVLPAILALDLITFGWDFNTVSDPKLLDFTPPSVEFIQQDPEIARITSFNQDDTLRPNTAMLYGLQDIRGYDTVIPRQYVEYWSQMEPPQGLLYSMLHKLVDPASLTSPWLDLLNVKYILTTQNIGLPNLREVYRGEVNIYLNEDYLPRTFLAGQAIVAPPDQHYQVMEQPGFDPRRTVVLAEAPPDGLTEGTGNGTATITRYEPNRVTVRVSTPEPAYLVLTDSYFLGWNVEVDGEPAPLIRADGIFRAVAVPAGTHEVAFRYLPLSFRNGLFVSFVSVLVVGVGGLILGWQRFFQRVDGLSPAQRVARNSLTPMLTQLFNKLVDFGFAIFTLRILGPVDAGKLAFAVVVIGYFSIITDFGLGTLLTRDVARARGQANRYLANTIALRLWLCLATAPLLAGVILLYSWRFDLASDAAIALALFAVGLLPSALSAALSSVFSAHEQMEVPAVTSVVTTILKVALGMAALLAGYGIVGLAAVSVLASTITAIIFYILVRRTFFVPRWEVDGAFQRGMVGTAYPLMLNNFLSTIFFRIDVVLLKPMRGDAEVGWYTTAYKFVDGLNLIPSFFTLALFPVFARYAHDSRDALRSAFILALKVLIVIAIPITIGTTLIADRIINLFFTEEYAPSIAALQVLIWFLPFSYVNSVTHYVLIAVNQQRFLTLAFILGASFNLIGNLLVIPTHGMLGAAVMTIISEFILLAPFFYAVNRHVGSVPLPALFWRPVLAGVVMGLAVWAVHDLNLLVIGLVAVATYAPILFLLRPFSPRERSILLGAVLRRRGAAGATP